MQSPFLLSLPVIITLQVDELSPGCSFSATIVDSARHHQARLCSPNGCLFVWLGSVVSGFLKSHLSVRHSSSPVLQTPFPFRTVSASQAKPSSHRVKLRKQTNTSIFPSVLLLFGLSQLVALSAIGTHPHRRTCLLT